MSIFSHLHHPGYTSVLVIHLDWPADLDPESVCIKACTPDVFTTPSNAQFISIRNLIPDAYIFAHPLSPPPSMILFSICCHESHHLKDVADLVSWIRIQAYIHPFMLHIFFFTVQRSLSQVSLFVQGRRGESPNGRGHG
jgi:hypothetical protein